MEMYVIFGRARDLYLCLYNQLFALLHCVFKTLKIFKTLKQSVWLKPIFLKKLRHVSVLIDYLQGVM